MTTSTQSEESETLEAVLERLEQVYGEELSGRDHLSKKSTKSGADDSSSSDTQSNIVINGNGNGHITGNSNSDGVDYDDPDTSMLPLLVAICLIPHNQPDDFARLFRYFADSGKHSSTIILPKLVLRLRTALFKAVPLVGVPRIINALSALNQAVSEHPRAEEVFSALPLESTKPTKTTEQDSAAGWAFFKAIYAQHAEKIINNIGKTSPDLAEMIVDELYGANLSRTEVLSWKETVLIEFTGW